MAYVKTRKAPASAPWGYEWPDTETVVEVADEHATTLLRIAGAEFYESLPGDLDYPGELPDGWGDEPVADPGEIATDVDDAPRTPIAEPDPDLYEPEAGGNQNSSSRTRTRNRH